VVTAWRTEAFAKRVPATPHRGALQAPFERAPARVEVGPLSLGALGPRALERDRGRAGSATQDSSPAEPLPLSAGLSELLTDRLTGFDATTSAALFVAAAASPATLELVGGVIAQPPTAALEHAVAAGIVHVDGELVEFDHPLFAAAAYNALAPGERRRWHARIAEAATDPETSARHLALARPGVDPEVAALLADAARHARERGALGASAELFAEAIDRLEPDPAAGSEAARERAELVLEAAPVLAAAGEPDRARRLLEACIGDLDSGRFRASLVLELAQLVGDLPGGSELETRLVEQVLDEGKADIHLMARALLDREQASRSGDRLADALPIAREALKAAEASGDEALLAAAHVRTADLEVVLGLGGDPVERFGRALELAERHRVDAQDSAASMLAVCLIRRGQIDEARPYVVPERERAIAEGDEASVSWVCMYLAELEWLAGRWDLAEAYAREGEDVAERAGMRMRVGALRNLVALVQASRGDAAKARELGIDAVAILDDVGELAYGNYARNVVGFIELSLGDAASAHRFLSTYDLERGVEGTKRLSFVGDDIEARVLLGDLDGAASLADEVSRRGAELGRRTMTAAAARGRALVLGARGDLDGALAAAEQAVEIHAAMRLPFEHARSLLVLGEVQRRAKRRKAARDTLTEAEAAFERLGASRWADRARAERARIGGRTTIEGLSETELRVAELVAAGRSNKEVAAELFVSVRAVEANLSRVYAKLGIESRTELARRL
jgi:DNA-binding NarL/FixJ family response regulator